MHMKLIIFFVLLGAVTSSSPFDLLKSKLKLSPETTVNAFKSIKAPDSLDWRTKGVITPVRDQGIAGKSDAFASVELIETLHAIQTGDLRMGSVARVIDCCQAPVDTFQCIYKLGGICFASDYPAPTGKCVPNACKPFATFDKLLRLKSRSEDDMVAWIQNSTLFVGLDASRPSFELYQGGIYSDPGCSKTMIDHTMQVVGYGKTPTGDLYWICKNTWSPTWGEQGYIRILRGNNTCGIATYVLQVA